MPKPLHPETPKYKKPRYRTIHSNLDPNSKSQLTLEHFLLSKVSQRLRKRARITYWQLNTESGAQTDNSIAAILLKDEPFGLVTKLRSDYNYEFINFFRPYRFYPHKNIKKIFDYIKKQLVTKYPKLKEKDFEIQSYDLHEFGPFGNNLGKKVHILIKLPNQALIVLYEDHFGLTIFSRA